jgi:uncharacterized protein
MKLIVFGATGQVGIQAVKQGLWNNHQVRAFGRNTHTINLEDKNLELYPGAVFDENQVYDALKDCDAVLSALGGSFDGEDKTRSLGMKRIVDAMTKADVKRIIAVGGLGVLNAPDGRFILDTPNYPAEYLPVGREHLQAYQHLDASDLDWTFICAPNIINAEATGNLKTSADVPPQDAKGEITAGDLALFMMQELKNREYVRKRVGISN